jgi:hypothetical protein
MSFLPPALLLAVATAMTLAGPAGAAQPHQHGVAQLNVVVEPARVTLELDTPLDNLLGFERAPRTDAERDKAAAAVATLRAGDTLFRLAGAAGCSMAKVELQSAALALGPQPAAGSKDAREGHAELEGLYEFKCKDGSKASFLEVGLFEAFPGFKRIELQVVTPRGQVKATLVRPASRVQLVR